LGQSCGQAPAADFFATRDFDRSHCPLATCAGFRPIVRHLPRSSLLVSKKSAVGHRGRINASPCPSGGLSRRRTGWQDLIFRHEGQTGGEKILCTAPKQLTQLTVCEIQNFVTI
jgi:hypothetical protein